MNADNRQAVSAAAPVLLVVGIHREELPFGEAVAARVDRGAVDVLAIPDGLTGRRPRPDQRFHHAMLHRELYLQLLPHVVGHYRLLVDLHTGQDRHGPSAELYCADEALRTCLAATIGRHPDDTVRATRIVPFAAAAKTPHEAGHAPPHAVTVIPGEVWENAAFRYLGMEIYLPAPGAGSERAWLLADELIDIATACVR
ncbi:hypothetical protein [Pseudothauera rhizosphaerae]|uniref:Uncharacterized protein n=1 Tax=Pseudothauera rhizosphaerae TaxID=2565932 RepID=A0A4V3WBH5_9RHOO|nr:hypothetical protein [Pseudothauera rhizosphaerae]THF63253.1 hypothetical protein E6O51_04070 [Pseudothauera rhizosphaerae]